MMQFSIVQNMLICELGVKKQEGREPDAHQNGHATRHDSLSKIILHGTLDTAPWKVGDTADGRGNHGCTTQKSGHLCPFQNCPQEPGAEKTGRGSLLNRPSCPLDDPVGQGTELNWTESKCLFEPITFFLSLSSSVTISWCRPPKRRGRLRRRGRVS